MSVPGLFTHGSPRHRLPHPPIPVRLMLAAHAAFVEVFAKLRANPPTGFVLATAGEKAITRQVKDILANDLLPNGTVDGFSKTFFSKVTRDEELTSYDGGHPDKKPDLVLGLQRPEGTRVIADQDAIFVECKPVDNAHSLTTDYGADGICRFVEGEYAWAMTSAMMLGYVRDGFTITRHLRANFTKNKSDARFGKPVLGHIVPGSVKGAKHEALRTSRHRRGFSYPANSRPAPPITICNSWHDCT